jgi:rhodanese-related sulfurtransferase
MDDRTRKITTEELIKLIDADAAPLIYDVRREPAFASSDMILPNAAKMDHETIADNITVTVGTVIVVYCVHGHEVSQGAAASLTAAGHDARFLEGGIEGYREAGGQTLRKDVL